MKTVDYDIKININIKIIALQTREGHYNVLRCKKQSYLKQRRQKSVWKECRLCSLWTDLAKGPSMLGVQRGGNFTGLDGSRRSLYLQERERNTVTLLLLIAAKQNWKSKTVWTCDIQSLRTSWAVYENVGSLSHPDWECIMKRNINLLFSSNLTCMCVLLPTFSVKSKLFFVLCIYLFLIFFLSVLF